MEELTHLELIVLGVFVFSYKASESIGESDPSERACKEAAETLKEKGFLEILEIVDTDDGVITYTATEKARNYVLDLVVGDEND